MSTIAGGPSNVSHTTATASPTPPVPKVTASDGAAMPDRGDPFGPAVIIDISPAATESADRIAAADDRVRNVAEHYAGKLRETGQREEDQAIRSTKIDEDIRAGSVAAAGGVILRADQPPAMQQDGLESALGRNLHAPQPLIDAVRSVGRAANDVRAANGGAYSDPAVLQRLRETHGDETLDRVLADAQTYMAQARANAFSSASALTRYGIDGPAFDVGDDNQLKLNSFSLRTIPGGFMLTFDAATSELRVYKSGFDITSAILAGSTFA